MKYGIAIFPQKKVQDVANSFRKRYDPRYTLIQPHITLKEAFELEEEKLPEVVEHLERVAAETAPFTIHFHKVSTFHPITNVIYLALTDNEPVTRLHEKINSDPIYHKSRFDYTPHLTIGQELSDDELHDIYGSLRLKKFDLTSLVDRFHLLYQLENESWTVYQSFLLRGKTDPSLGERPCGEDGQHGDPGHHGEKGRGKKRRPRPATGRIRQGTAGSRIAGAG